MKQMILMLAVILTAFALLLLLCGAGAGEPPYVGEWELDTEHSPVDVGELYLMFGSSLRTYGAKLTLRADGTMDWYVGLTGGKGTYSADGDTLTADVTSYTEGHRSELKLDFVDEDGAPYLILHLHDEVSDTDLRWTKRE